MFATSSNPGFLNYECVDSYTDNMNQIYYHNVVNGFNNFQFYTANENFPFARPSYLHNNELKSTDLNYQNTYNADSTYECITNLSNKCQTNDSEYLSNTNSANYNIPTKTLDRIKNYIAPQDLSEAIINSTVVKKEQKSKKVRRIKQSHHQLPEEAVIKLNCWFETHISHPYPSSEEKYRLATECNISFKQVNSWFCNRRNRSHNTKPKRIKRQLEQEISCVYNELVTNPNKTQVIEKFRSTLILHDISVSSKN